MSTRLARIHQDRELANVSQVSTAMALTAWILTNVESRRVDVTPMPIVTIMTVDTPVFVRADFLETGRIAGTLMNVQLEHTRVIPKLHVPTPLVLLLVLAKVDTKGMAKHAKVRNYLSMVNDHAFQMHQKRF